MSTTVKIAVTRYASIPTSVYVIFGADGGIREVRAEPPKNADFEDMGECAVRFDVAQPSEVVVPVVKVGG